MTTLEKRVFKKIRIDFTGDDPVIDVEYGETIKVLNYKDFIGSAVVYTVERINNGGSGVSEIIGCYHEKELALNALESFRLPSTCEISFKPRGMCDYLYVTIDSIDEMLMDIIFNL